MKLNRKAGRKRARYTLNAEELALLMPPAWAYGSIA